MSQAQPPGESHEQRVRRLLAVIGLKMGVTAPRYGGSPEVPPSDYSCWTHQIHVEEETARALADSELALLLAHEVGHSTRRAALVAARLATLLPVAVGVAMSKGWLDWGGSGQFDAPVLERSLGGFSDGQKPSTRGIRCR